MTARPGDVARVAVEAVRAGQDAGPGARQGYTAALRRAREAGYPAGEFAGQESFMLASEILDLARAAGVGRGTRVLDLCCGVAGPGRLVTRTLGCDYLGVDRSPSAVEVARELSAGLPCRFEVGEVPAVPAGTFDVVLLLETILAFPDKDAVFRAVARALARGGRFALTVEEGAPLTAAERAAMPDAGTVHLVRQHDLVAGLARAGLDVAVLEDHSAAHLATVTLLHDSYAADADAISAQVGRRTLDDLLASHALWRDWLAAGRVRKLAVVAARRPTT